MSDTRDKSGGMYYLRNIDTPDKSDVEFSNLLEIVIDVRKLAARFKR